MKTKLLKHSLAALCVWAACYGVAQAEVSKEGWSIQASSEHKHTRAHQAIDGNTGSMWHSNYWKRGATQPPHTLTINMGKLHRINAVTYLPRQTGNMNGTIKDYEVLVSTDGATWKSAALGAFANDRSKKTAQLAQAECAQYFRLVAKSEVNNNPWGSAAEIGVEGQLVASCNDAEPPMEPTENPTQPTENPTQPTENPTQPTENPTQPTENPTQPTENPTQPTENPTQPTEVSNSADLAKGKWSIEASSSHSSGNPQKAIDGNTASIWHSNYWKRGGGTKPPHTLTINMGEPHRLDALTYLPRQRGMNGTIKDYEVLVSTDGATWNSVASGAFAKNNSLKTTSFAQTECVQYFRLVAKSEVNNNVWGSAAEIGAKGVSCSTTPPPPPPTENNSSELAKDKWSIHSFFSQDSQGLAKAAIDGDKATGWHTAWRKRTYRRNAEHPHDIVIDLNEFREVDSLSYTSRAHINGRIKTYEIEVSNDAENWTKVKSGTFPNEGATTTKASFEGQCARFVKLTSTASYQGPWTTVNEIDLTATDKACSTVKEKFDPANLQSSSRLYFTKEELDLAVEDPRGLINRWDLLLMGGSMDDAMKDKLVAHIESMPISKNGALRAREALFLIVTSSQQAIQK